MNVLGVFVKYPAAGEVKTRLARSIGADAAARLYSAFSADVLDRFRSTADLRFLCHSPLLETRESYFRMLAGEEYRLWPQPAVDLGGRMQQFFEHAFRSETRNVVVIGSDSPTLPTKFVTQAFELLSNHDYVLGPAEDGGYYLIGIRSDALGIDPRNTETGAVCWPAFDQIDWSTPRVLEQTRQRIESAGASLGVLPPWYDVDSTDDLSRLRADLANPPAGECIAGSQSTATVLAELEANRPL